MIYNRISMGIRSCTDDIRRENGRNTIVIHRLALRLNKVQTQPFIAKYLAKTAVYDEDTVTYRDP